MEVCLLTFLTLALDGNESSATHDSCFAHGPTIRATSVQLALEPVWMRKEKRKFDAHARDQTPVP